MKKSYLFRNSLLPLLGALAVMCAGSCSQEILEVPGDLAPGDVQTRASVAAISLVSNPVGTGAGKEYYEKDLNYTFTLVTSGTDSGIDVVSTNISYSYGIDGGVVKVSQTAKSVTLRFTKSGVYEVLATRNYRDRANPSGPVMSQRATLTCRVQSIWDIDPSNPGGTVVGWDAGASGVNK